MLPVILVKISKVYKYSSKEFTSKYPGLFHEINMQVMSRADDVISQITYYLFKMGNKKSVPGILKNSWAKKISSLSEYGSNKAFERLQSEYEKIRVRVRRNNEVIQKIQLYYKKR